MKKARVEAAAMMRVAERAVKSAKGAEAKARLVATGAAFAAEAAAEAAEMAADMAWLVAEAVEDAEIDK